MAVVKHKTYTLILAFHHVKRVEIHYFEAAEDAAMARAETIRGWQHHRTPDWLMIEGKDEANVTKTRWIAVSSPDDALTITER